MPKPPTRQTPTPRLPPVQFLKCEQCGHDRAEHEHANLADGPFVGRYLLICPTAVFKAAGHDQAGRALNASRSKGKP